jgi:hypothetical protein
MVRAGIEAPETAVLALHRHAAEAEHFEAAKTKRRVA